jgi:glutathione S-transferase
VTDVPLLYSFRRCPYAIRARMALLVSRVPFAVHEVDLRDKPAAMTAASPKGTVPVLICADGQVLDESLDIMRWALRQNDPEDWLSGDDATLVQTFDTRFKHHLDRYKYAAPASPDQTENRDACVTMLQDLDARLTASSNLCRGARSFTDIALIPFIRQFAGVDRTWFDAQSLPHLHQWLATHLASPLFVEAMLKPRHCPA